MSDAQQTEPLARSPLKVEYTWVKSGLTGADKDKVALNEWDPAHPENAEGRTEIWVAGADSPPVKVAKTPAVVQHIRDGELIEVAESDSDAHKVKFDAAMREREKAQMEAHPAFAGIAAGLRARGLTLHEVMTGEPSAAPKSAASAMAPLTDAERAELDGLRAKQAANEAPPAPPAQPLMPQSPPAGPPKDDGKKKS